MRSRIRTFLTLAFFLLILGTLGTAAAGFVAYRVYADDLKPPEQQIAENAIGNSYAFDKTGAVQLHRFVDPQEGLKDPVVLSEISPYLVAATIATEDASFYDNPGVNFRGVARAAVENLTPFGPGFLQGSGGSSITQQLVKNVYIDKDAEGLAPRTVERKVKETVIALELKRKYSDDQILEWYLNQIFYGRFAYGAEAASQSFFGKHAKDLTLGEASLLAGLPQAPSYYDPTDPDKLPRAKARQEEVLALMLKHRNAIKGFVDVTPEQVEAAKLEPFNFVDSFVDIKSPHFVFFVEDQVKKMCEAGLFDSPGPACEKVVSQGGLRITTTIDMGLQGIGERIVEQNIGANENRYNGHNGSLVAIHPATGEILAYVGSRDFKRDDIAGQVDIATSAQSHGSTMKVFTYLTAFEKGWVPSTLVQDALLLLDVGGQKKQVHNWNDSHLGNITVRKALSESVNTAAVRTLMEVGGDEMRDTAHRLGITDLRQGDCGPTITLGACEVKLVDMTFAFASLANNGVMKGRPTSEDLPSGFRELDPVSVLKIEDDQGSVLYQYAAPEQRQVVDAAAAFMVTDVLSNEAINWSRLTVDRPAAAKTGTSEDFRDGVVMGYTPDLSVGVWMGNADNSPMAPGTFSSAGTGPMWRQFMTEALAYTQWPAKPFEKPADVVTSTCSGHEEVFKANVEPSKPGACRAPAPQPPPGSSPTPKPALSPSFPAKNTPKPSPTLEPSPTETPAPSPDGDVFYYTVVPDDTLEDIAARFGTTVEAIAALNGIDPDDPLIPGTVLAIPAPPVDPTTSAAQFGADLDRRRLL
jgi:membrane peptidoglycan carboxypeptidase